MNNTPTMIDLLNDARLETVDLLTLRIGYLYIIELVKKTGSHYFTHNGINMELNAEVISIGLKANVKDYFIRDYGLAEGIDRAYHALKCMCADSTGEAGSPDSLTDWGREALNVLLTSICDELKANDSGTVH